MKVTTTTAAAVTTATFTTTATVITATAIASTVTTVTAATTTVTTDTTTTTITTATTTHGDLCKIFFLWKRQVLQHVTRVSASPLLFPTLGSSVTNELTNSRNNPAHCSMNLRRGKDKAK